MYRERYYLTCATRMNRFRLKESKCQFLSDEMDYLGHRIDAEGIHPSGGALSAVRDVPAPTNVTELRSYIGAVNHCAGPTHQLLQNDVKWHWSKAQRYAFNKTTI